MGYLYDTSTAIIKIFFILKIKKVHKKEGYFHDEHFFNRCNNINVYVYDKTIVYLHKIVILHL